MKLITAIIESNRTTRHCCRTSV